MDDTLLKLFSEELDVGEEDLNDDSSPDNVESWDSLAAVRLVAAIESEFNIRLSSTEIMKMRTIGMARKVLQSKGVEV